jgi:hypothetical protein
MIVVIENNHGGAELVYKESYKVCQILQVVNKF